MSNHKLHSNNPSSPTLRTNIERYIYIFFFSGVSNFLGRSFYKLYLRKELLSYNWNQFGGRVHVGGWLVGWLC